MCHSEFLGLQERGGGAAGGRTIATGADLGDKAGNASQGEVSQGRDRAERDDPSPGKESLAVTCCRNGPWRSRQFPTSVQTNRDVAGFLGAGAVLGLGRSSAGVNNCLAPALVQCPLEHPLSCKMLGPACLRH